MEQGQGQIRVRVALYHSAVDDRTFGIKARAACLPARAPGVASVKEMCSDTLTEA